MCPAWIGERQVLVEQQVLIGGGPVDVRIDAASPSDHAFQRSIADFDRSAPLMPHGRSRPVPIRRLVAVEPNHTAIVLHASIGGISILFGSDLEISTSSADGWSRVTDFLKGRQRAQVVKIPHHGSVTGHQECMWTDLLTPNPTALLTPFARGRVSLPTEQDVERILDRTPHAYISCSPKKLQLRHPSKVVQKMVDDITTSPLVAQAASGGIIRLTYDLLSPVREWTIELVDGALSLADLAQAQRRAAI